LISPTVLAEWRSCIKEYNTWFFKYWYDHTIYSLGINNKFLMNKSSSRPDSYNTQVSNQIVRNRLQERIHMKATRLAEALYWQCIMATMAEWVKAMGFLYHSEVWRAEPFNYRPSLWGSQPR
jgi:hypothetical protein